MEFPQTNNNNSPSNTKPPFQPQEKNKNDNNLLDF